MNVSIVFVSALIYSATEFYNAEFIPLSSLPPRTPIDYTQLFTADNVANGLSAEEDSNAVMSPLQSSAAGHVGAAGGTFASPPSDAKYMYGTRASLPVVSRTTSGVAVPTHQVDGDPIHNAAPPPVEDSSTATAVQSREITEDFEIVDKPVTDASTPFSEGKLFLCVSNLVHVLIVFIRSRCKDSGGFDNCNCYFS